MVNNQYGRPCPSVLRQQVPCPYRPCYEWRPFNWTECLLDGAHCGTGTRHQIMACILAETGKAVDAEFCRLRQQEPSSRSKSRSLAHVAEASCKLLCSFGKFVLRNTAWHAQMASERVARLERRLRSQKDAMLPWREAAKGSRSKLIILNSLLSFNSPCPLQRKQQRLPWMKRKFW